MPIKISKTLAKKLPDDEQSDIEEYLWLKSGGRCFLCGAEFNRASEIIVPDHDIPEKEGGNTTRENLNLAHGDCNSSKRNSPSVPIKPYLAFQVFVKKHGHKVTYGDSVSHFSITPKTCSYTREGDLALFDLPDGKKVRTPIFSEKNERGSFSYVYLEIPREALFNDPDCQPRTIKLLHLWSIYTDLQHNPLHEAPGCRIEETKQKDMVKLLMFDGQHKTIANWLMGRKTIVTKVYLDLSAASAIELVNSIQAKIKKLPLSPFELANKLADEWQGKWAQYEAKVGQEKASERGFIDWLPQPERTRGKQAFRAALLNEILTDEDLEFRKIIRGPTATANELTVTENTFKTKVLEKMIVLDPLEESAEEAQILRTREKNSVVKVLNIFTDHAFTPDDGALELTAVQKERMKRMLYQIALEQIAKFLRAVVGYRLASQSPKEFIEKEPTAEQWDKITDDIKRLIDHLVWTAEFDVSKKMTAVYDALQKNQDFDKAVGSVGLKLGYLVGADKLEVSCIQD